MGYIFRLSFANLKLRKLRTVLTIVGIMIGIMSVVTMLTAGIGARRAMVEQVEKVGSTREIHVYSTDTTRKDRILTDSTVLKFEKLGNVTGVYPVVSLDGTEKMGSFMGYNAILGVPEEYMDSLKVAEGEYPKQNGSRPQILAGLGSRYVFYNDRTGQIYGESSKGTRSLAGQRLEFKLMPMDIPKDEESEDREDEFGDVSDTEEKASATDAAGAGGATSVDGEDEQSGSVDSDTSAGEENEDERGQILNIVGETDNEYDYNFYTDIDTLKYYIKRQSVDGYMPGQPRDKDDNPYKVWVYSEIILRVDKTENVEAVSKVVRDMGYRVENNLEMLKSVNHTIGTMQMVLGIIGAIAIVVAVIGIINTMMTAVYDRVREIALLRMLGSDSDDINFMFLFESALMGFVGGVLGVILSLVVNYFINGKLVALMEMPKDAYIMHTPLWMILIVIVASTLVSVLAGAFPARWAAHIKPLEALYNN